MSSLGDTSDFGDLSGQIREAASASNQTRGLNFGGKQAPGVYWNNIEYVTIASTGNAIDFGDMNNIIGTMGALASQTRAVVGGGEFNSPYPTTDAIEFVTISTTGNATDFGDLTDGEWAVNGCSNSIRGIFVGTTSPTRAAIESITIATLGNSVKFGDRNYTEYALAAFADSNRAVFAGGSTVNTMDYVQIMTDGDATDYGDLTVARGRLDGCSNGHGGL